MKMRMADIADRQIEYPFPPEWFFRAAWPSVRDWLKWLPLDYAERKQLLILWADRTGEKLTAYHYEAIAQPGEPYTGARGV